MCQLTWKLNQSFQRASALGPCCGEPGGGNVRTFQNFNFCFFRIWAPFGPRKTRKKIIYFRYGHNGFFCNWWDLLREVFVPGEIFSGEFFFRGDFFWGGFLQGRFFLGRFFSRGGFFQGRFILGRLFPGRFFLGEVFTGEFFSGRFFPGRFFLLPKRDEPYHGLYKDGLIYRPWPYYTIL